MNGFATTNDIDKLFWIESEDDWRVRFYVLDTYRDVDTTFSLHKTDVLTTEMYQNHLRSLIEHIGNVRIAGEMIGVPKEQLFVHDNSKFDAEEFPHYARQYHGDRGDPDGYATAWLHHIHHNPHHWSHWIFPGGYTTYGSNVENGVVEMPTKYALEMIADWMGANMTYQGNWDMTKWLWENMSKIKLHSKTLDYVCGQLDMLGYADTVYCDRWGREFGNG